jgi:two-component system NtrC family response regulator
MTSAASALPQAAPLVLVADDDEAVRLSLKLLLVRHGFRVTLAASVEEALARAEDPALAAVLQDMNFSLATSGREGLELLARLRARRPELPVLLLTAWGSIALAVEGMKLGAADFLTKPWSNDGLLQALRTALAVQPMRTEAPAVPTSRAGLGAEPAFAAICGQHPRLLAVLDLVARVAPTDASVLVLGESGTGKELVAQALHAASPRRQGPFVRVNLGGLPTSLFESEMFGHLRGAFTDARSDRKGRFELADRGTIFLDEIGELELGAQVKLLRVLQDKTFEPLGSSTPRRVDVRVVAATNRDLAALVGQGLFREDLFYRLNLVTLRLPALRERASDIPLLVERFASRAAAAWQRPEPRFTAAALAWLGTKPWPGNVRELEQTVQRAVLLAQGTTIDRHDLEPLVEPLGATPRSPQKEPSPGLPPAIERAGVGSPPALLDAAAPSGGGGGGAGIAPTPDAAAPTLERVERALVEQALARHGGNVSRAAAELGLSRGAFYRRLERFGLRLPSDP